MLRWFRRARELEAACGCVIGLRRTNNEDNFLFQGIHLERENRGLDRILTWRTALETPVYLAVFDGMGGEAYGEEASWIAAKTLKSRIERQPGERIALEDVCLEANRQICRQARARGVGLEGSTAAILCLWNGEAEMVNLGDSRVFLLRGGTLRQLSVDHTDQALLQAQGITARKPRLTQHLGIEPEDMVLQPSALRTEARAGDRFLLCSDGLTDMVEEEKIRQILGAPQPMDRVAEELIRQAMESGGRDNTTVICCEVRA